MLLGAGHGGGGGGTCDLSNEITQICISIDSPYSVDDCVDHFALTNVEMWFIAFHLSSPPPLCGAISADDKYKCKPADQVRASSVTGTCVT